MESSSEYGVSIIIFLRRIQILLIKIIKK